LEPWNISSSKKLTAIADEWNEMLRLYQTVTGKSIPCVMYADDIILFSYQMDWLDNLLEKVVEFCNFKGLQLTPQECAISDNIKDGMSWKIDSMIFKIRTPHLQSAQEHESGLFQ